MRAVILLGGDTGDVVRTLGEARRMIEERAGEITAASEVLTSRAWGFDSERTFYNQALCVDTGLSPESLLDALQSVERDCGRDRQAEAEEKLRTGQPYASRVLDADIIFCGGQVVDTPRLKVPHPLVARRGFALRPLAQIVPQLRHPVTGLTVSEMLAGLTEIENEKDE